MKRTFFYPIMIVFLLTTLALATFYASAFAAPFQQDEQPQEQAQAAFDAGLALFDRGEYQAALEAFAQASVLYRTVDNQEGEAAALGYMGMTNKFLGDWEAAITALTTSLPLLTALDRPESLALVHNELAFDYLQLGDAEQAQKHAATALTITIEKNFPAHRATAHLYLGIASWMLDMPHTALFHFEVGLPLMLELKRTEESELILNYMAGTVTRIAQIAQANAHYGQALAQYKRAQTIYQALENRAQEGWVLNEVGSIYNVQAKYQAAQTSFQTALSLCQEAQYQPCQVAALNNLGEVYDNLGQYREALAQHEEALSFCEAIDDCPYSSADLLHNLGRDYINLGNYREASAQLDSALLAARQAVDRQQEANILNTMANLAIQQANYAAALDFCHTALAIFQEIQFAEGEETVLGSMGSVYQYQGRLSEALRYYQQSLALAQKIGDLSGEATAYGNMGGVYEATGQYEEALRQQQAALKIWRMIGNFDGQTVVYNQLGSVYDSLGEYTKALAAYDDALALARDTTGHRKREISALNNKAATLFKLAYYDDALAMYQEVLTITQAIGLPEFEAMALGNIASVHVDLDQHQAALIEHEASLAIRQRIGDRIGEGVSLHNIGVVYRDLAEYEQALKYFAAAQAIFQGAGRIDAQVETFDSIGWTYQQQGKLPEAIKAYQQAVETSEILQGNLVVEEYATSFGATQITKYSHLINALIDTPNSLAAFDYAEQARARAFLDQIGNQRVDIHYGAAPALISQEQTLYAEIVGLQNAIKAEQGKPIDQQNLQLLTQDLPQRLDLARQQHAELLILLKQENPEYAALISVDTLQIQEVQQQVLDAQTTLIAYYITDEHVLAWVIDQTEVTFVRLDARPEDLIDKVEFLRNLINAQEFDADTGATLYEMLFAPLKPHIHHPNLIIVPHGVLHYLPFAALWNAEEEHYLIEDYAVTYAPSASALKFILDKRNDDQGRLLALGNPDGSLTNADDEARAVARLYATTALVRGKATESQVYAQAGQIDILHLAAHAVFNPINPLYTRIELAPDADNGPDGNLEVHEIFGLNLTGVNLVVLSACATALGEQSNGDELVGLTRAFLYAGTPAVITTLWPIADEASGALMVAFYQNLRAGMTNAEALRTAQRDVLAREEWNTPYYWAAFSLTGDYRGSGEPQVALMNPRRLR